MVATRRAQLEAFSEEVLGSGATPEHKLDVSSIISAYNG